MKYPSDLTDAEWIVLKNILLKELPEYKNGRKKDIEELRDICDAIYYLNKTGVQWEYLPNDYPPHTTVSYHYNKWKRLGLFEKLNTELRRSVRKKLERSEEPTAALRLSRNLCYSISRVKYYINQHIKIKLPRRLEP